MINTAYIDFLKYCLNDKADAPESIIAIDWCDFLGFCRKQAIIGIVFEGIKRCLDHKLPHDVLYPWIGMSRQLKYNNIHLNQRSAEIQQIFARGGFKSCILKGQGNAQMYPNPYSRMSGDIDLWVEGEREKINQFILSHVKDARVKFKDVAFTYKDVEIETHYFPTYLNNFWKNKRLQKYIAEQKNRQMEHWIVVKGEEEDLRICTPTDDFNIVYQMSHILHHFFCEGIGLRHFIDYYYLLKRCNLCSKEVVGLLNEFGLMEFAHGAMWIEQEILGLDNSFLIVQPDEKTGMVIWKEIMQYGNFNCVGSKERTALQTKLNNTLKPFHYVFQFPRYSFDRLMFISWLQIWKLKNKL